MIGTTLSHFEITSKLGEGGMGEVYRAQDTKLGREVAIKKLPESFALDPERLARFEREAKVLASLNHPNIAAIYSFEHASVGGPTREGESPSPTSAPIHFLVMELAEGETLAERIKRGPVPVKEAVRLAEQIAEAVEAAHEKGVVHRDLKPGNVTVDDEGQVKVLDFGLAKALSPEPISDSDLGEDLSMSPTLTQAMTGAGVLLGTAGYMSPEQARGKSVDRRADIWAFGCMLYEMLTGRRLYRGETATDVVAAIVHGEPNLEDLPAGVPERIRRLLERCLQKDPSRRLQSIGDARIALQEWLENPETVQPVTSVGPRRSWLIPLTAVVAVALGLLIGKFIQPAREPEPVRR
jgi:serine/threonine-protein kinase